QSRVFIISSPLSRLGRDRRRRRGRLAADWRLRATRLAGLQAERELERIRAVGLSYVVADQRLGHAKLAVGLEVRILGIVDLRGDGLEAGLVDEEVDMRWSIIVTALRAEQRAGRSFGGHRIAGRFYALEAERAVGVRLEAPAQIHVRLLGILVFVQAGGRGLPHIDLRVLDRLARHVADPTAEVQPRS